MAVEESATIIKSKSNNISRVWMEIPALKENIHCGAGLFFESRLNNLDDLSPMLNRVVQTVTYAGFEPIDFVDFVKSSPLKGIDRFVPFGKALDFATIWDGFELKQVFMRNITIS